MSSEPPTSVPILYFDANSLHYYRSRRKDCVEPMDALFVRSQTGEIICLTSTFTRSEMLNIAKRAAYAIQELEGGRLDIEKVVEEARRHMRVHSAGLATAREKIDSWLREQVISGRLRVQEPPDHTAVWRLAESLMEHTSISGTGDCTHVSTAILMGSTFLITDDEHLRWCVESELVTEGDPRERIRNALAGLTGTDELSMRAVAIKAAPDMVHLYIAESAKGIQTPEECGASAEPDGGT